MKRYFYGVCRLVLDFAFIGRYRGMFARPASSSQAVQDAMIPSAFNETDASALSCVFGMKLSACAPVQQLRRISIANSNIPGFIAYNPGVTAPTPAILENTTAHPVNFPDPAISHLVWEPHSIALHPGELREEAVIRHTIRTSGLYVVLCRFVPLGRHGKTTQVSISINDVLIWVSAAPDTFLQKLELSAGDSLDFNCGCLPRSDYTDTTTVVSFAIFLEARGELIRMDEGRSSPPESELVRIADLTQDLQVNRPKRAVQVAPAWRKVLFNSCTSNTDKIHLSACLQKPFDEIFDAIDSRDGKPEKKYIIFFTPRSGSTLLTECLSQTNSLGYPCEFFVEAFHQAVWLLNDGSETNSMDLLFRKFTTDNGVFGFEIDHDRFFNADEPILDDLSDWTVIYLTRRDLLAQAISLYKALGFGLWSVDHESTGTPYFDRQAIIEALVFLSRQMSGFETFFAERGIDPLRLDYETNLSDMERTVATIAETLGLQPDEIGHFNVARTAQRKLPSRPDENWAYTIVAEGGAYRGYDIQEMAEGYRASLAGADLSGLPRPERFRPLALYASTLEGLKAEIEQVVAEAAGT